ncbi:hypothetical protein N7490_006631 [Penicillium lividum]|nr:hypothetical protein N7490_006631 [Penicillium lividum]
MLFVRDRHCPGKSGLMMPVFREFRRDDSYASRPVREQSGLADAPQVPRPISTTKDKNYQGQELGPT